MLLKLTLLLCSLMHLVSGKDECNPLTLSSHKWAQNFTFSPNSVYKVRCPLIKTGGHCGIVNLVEWYRSEAISGPRVTVQTAYLIDPLTFYFQNPSGKDSAWYTCVVGNNVGVTEISTYITFKGFAEGNEAMPSVLPSALPLRSRPTQEIRIPVSTVVTQKTEEPESSTTIDDYLDYIQSMLRNQNLYTYTTPPTPKQIQYSSFSGPSMPSKSLRINGFTNFNWDKKSPSQSTASVSSKYSPPHEDQIPEASSSSLSTTSSFQTSTPIGPKFENKKWNTAYKDKDLSEHLRYIYERMDKLESKVQSLRGQIDLCCQREGPVGQY